MPQKALIIGSRRNGFNADHGYPLNTEQDCKAAAFAARDVLADPEDGRIVQFIPDLADANSNPQDIQSVDELKQAISSALSR